MSSGLRTPDVDNDRSNSFDIRDFAGAGPVAGAKEHDYLREFTRSPHPYSRRGAEIEQHVQGNANAQSQHSTDTGNDGKAPKLGRQDSAASATSVDEGEDDGQYHDRTRQTSTTTTTSESGTEADDERAQFIKALPPAHQRPRKGLKSGEPQQDGDGDTPLLTPSQLDDEGRRLSQSQEYFRSRLAAAKNEQLAEEEEKQKRAAQERLQRRRLAEFVRRTSEVALVGVISVVVLCGHGVWEQAWAGRRELLSHIAIIAALVVAYPVKLSIVDGRARYEKKPWQRFRVPASFDPATVLYPTFLPVLVALSIAPASPEVLLPNVILALASLPQRLFPRSSRLAGVNMLHWFVSVLPLVAAENTAWPYKNAPSKAYSLRAPPNALQPETLASLYALHHALMVPLHFLTTTSLLASELHLLSAVLINLLFFAVSPQAEILSSCLWIGGILLFVLCASVLHWNVTLARVPKWKLRRPGLVDQERKSLVDAASELINVQRGMSAFRSSSKADDSDADEDEPAAPIKAAAMARPKLRLGATFNGSGTPNGEFPKSAVEARSPLLTGVWPDRPTSGRKRRNTQPERHPPDLRQHSRRRGRPSHLLWCLRLTPDQAQRRKYAYAAYIYLTILAIILGPIRWRVGKIALQNEEPVGWALGYLFAQLPFLRPWIQHLHLTNWITLPPNPATLQTLQTSLTLPPNIPHLRLLLGAANLRLLLIAYWILILLLGLLAVFTLTAYVEVDTRRKVFHGVMVAMLLPATFVDPCFCSLALALIAAVFLILEVVRAGQVPPLGNAIGRFVAPYVDGRDLRGPVVVSHIFLLIGCAVPLWFSLATTDRAGDGGWEGWDVLEARRDVGMVAGVTCVGLGDAAASLIGRRYGRRKWVWIGGKSLEGSAAFVFAVTAGLMGARAWMVFGGWPHSIEGRKEGWGEVLGWIVALVKAVFCGCGASFMEAVLTGANDNVVVPVALWLLVKGVRL